MDNLNKEVRQMAISHGLCEKWQGEWKKDWPMNELIRRFYLGIDFYAKERFVSKEYMKEKLDKSFRRNNGILVDDKYSLINNRHIAVIGKSESTIRYNLWNTGDVRVFDNSNVTVIANTKSFVMVHLYDKAKVHAQARDNARIAIIRHSSECEADGIGDVRIKDDI